MNFEQLPFSGILPTPEHRRREYFVVTGMQTCSAKITYLPFENFS